MMQVIQLNLAKSELDKVFWKVVPSWRQVVRRSAFAATLQISSNEAAVKG